MKKTAFLILVSILSIGYTSGVARAQTPTLPYEAIITYNSNIIVNTDNSIDVTETITYNTGPQARHGIYRDIYPYSSTGRKMNIKVASVTNEIGWPYKFQTSNANGNVRVKIGDAAQMFTGQKIYVIKYHAANAIAQLNDVDEIYWNVTGNEWGIPIYETHASVSLPTNITPTQMACYYGPKGSTKKCETITDGNGVSTFTAPRALNQHEGLTVAAGFSKGIVAPYSASDVAANFFSAYFNWLFAIVPPVLTLIISLLYWFKKGKDPQGTGVIIPQYDVPDNLIPMEVVGIVNAKVTAKNISAEIIYLATKGYLKINKLDEQLLGFIHVSDYELSQTKDAADLPNESDRKLLQSLFNAKTKTTLSNLKNLLQVNNPPVEQQSSTNRTVKLSALKNVFYPEAQKVIALVLNDLLIKGYYKNLGKMKNGLNRILLFGVLIPGASIYFGAAISELFFIRSPLPLTLGICLSVSIYAIISYFSPAKTEKGVATKEYLLGLKEYLQIVEKDRLKFHNAPDKKPEVFEKLLPYAMVFGVVDIWAKEFEGIYRTPPSWYSGPTNTAFSAISFSHSLTLFSTVASSSLGVSGGGSGGGGSSGGGGGGGGGGGW